jgi:hypothetical protein
MPFVTAGDMIGDALEALRVYAPGEQVTPPDLARGLGILNRMIDSWSNESLFCFTILEQFGLLVVNQNEYKIGPAPAGIGIDFGIGVSPIGIPDWIMQRPIRIIGTPGSAYVRDGTGNKYQVDVVPLDKWNLVNTSQANSDIPDTIYYEPTYPYGTMRVYPTPNTPWTLAWTSYLQLDRFENSNAALTLPPGYEDAIVTNLAIRLKPYFHTAVLDPDLQRSASEAKAAVKRSNMRAVTAVMDPEIVSRGNTVYNIYTDRPTGRN